MLVEPKSLWVKVSKAKYGIKNEVVHEWGWDIGFFGWNDLGKLCNMSCPEGWFNNNTLRFIGNGGMGSLLGRILGGKL